MKALLTTCTSALLASFALAQTTIVVGPSGLPQVNHAIAVANDGDVILVEPGVYSPLLNTSKSVTIRAITPGSVTLAGPFGSFAIGSSQRLTLHLVGLHFDSLNASAVDITLDQCTTSNANGFWATDATVHLQSCQLSSSGFPLFETAAVRAQDSRLTAVDTTIQGSQTVSPGPAIVMTNSTFHGSHVDLLTHPGATSAALIADATSVVFLCESTATSQPGTCPLAAVQGKVFRTTLSPACGGPATGPVLGVSRVQPIQTGAPFTLQFAAQPFRPILVFASFGLDAFPVPQIEQDVLLDLSSTFLAGALLADAQGDAAQTWNIPAAPILVDRAVWFQGIGGWSLPLQASPVAGGVVH